MNTLPEALVALRGLDPARRFGAWSAAQVVAHCAQSVEFSLEGFPAPKSRLFQATVGRLVARRFLAKGALSHDLAAPIPGAPEVAEDTTFSDAIVRFERAAAAFAARPAESLRPHFAYGAVPKADYERLHALHVADHLRA